MYCLTCLVIVKELRTIEFFLINFQCFLDAIGSISDIFVNFSKSTIGYFDWKCLKSNLYVWDYFFYAEYIKERLVKQKVQKFNNSLTGLKIQNM